MGSQQKIELNLVQTKRVGEDNLERWRQGYQNQ